jgi:hypothetical protein
MAFELVQTAPHTSGKIETARNYAEGAGISIRLAQFIANLGYSATAEHLRYYQSLLVPLAVDAGLGKGGNGLQYLYAGLSLQPRQESSSQGDHRSRHAQQDATGPTPPAGSCDER